MPSYVANGIIEGFPEMGQRAVGLKHVADSPQIVGLWVWTSGGGWAGALPCHTHNACCSPQSSTLGSNVVSRRTCVRSCWCLSGQDHMWEIRHCGQ